MQNKSLNFSVISTENGGLKPMSNSFYPMVSAMSHDNKLYISFSLFLTENQVKSLEISEYNTELYHEVKDRVNHIRYFNIQYATNDATNDSEKLYAFQFNINKHLITNILIPGKIILSINGEYSPQNHPRTTRGTEVTVQSSTHDPEPIS